MAEPSDSIVEEREEWMVSLSPFGDRVLTLTMGYFLKPSLLRSPVEEPPIEPPSLSATPLIHKLKPNQRPLNVQFSGWRLRSKLWLEWLDQLHPTYQSVWKRVGIYEAILKFCYEIRRNDDVAFGIAERWNPKTNTFVFPWGEATITLEDVVVLGGYPVLGESVFSPLGTLELKEIEAKLLQARTKAGRGSYGKAALMAWIKMFKNSGSEIEHEAFLVAWLSGFVLPNSGLVRKLVFPIAVHLANGNRIALAPPVLAAIYRDLSLLKRATMVSAQQLDNFRATDFVSTLTLWSQFQLVQIWGWERFSNLQPEPNISKCSSDQSFARWHRVKCGKIQDVRLALDKAEEKFLWRPYAVRNWAPNFYPAKAKWIIDCLDEEEEEELHISFARFLRDPQLYGLDCTELYSPHRVARQFGLDQDVPSCVSISNKNSLGSLKLYIPSRLDEGQVTARYLDWWKNSMLGKKNCMNTPVKVESSPVKMKMEWDGNNCDGFGQKCYPEIDIGVPPGFAPKFKGTKCENVDEASCSAPAVPPGFAPKCKGTKCENVDEASCSAPAVPPGFAPKCKGTKCEIVDEASCSAPAADEEASGENMEDESEGEVDCGEENRTVRITEMELEARICRLERLDADLRAARFGNSSGS